MKEEVTKKLLSRPDREVPLLPPQMPALHDYSLVKVSLARLKHGCLISQKNWLSGKQELSRGSDNYIIILG